MATAHSKVNAPVGQRVHHRFRISSCQINLIKVGGILVKLLGNKKEYKASLVNISRTGLQLVTPDQLNPDEDYNITLFLPGAGDVQEVKAKVVWSSFFRKEIHTRYYRVGLKFTKISRETEYRLRQFESKYVGGS